MDSLFFWTSKLVWLFIAPDSLLLIALTVGVAALWFGKVGLSKWILTIVAMVMLIIAFLPVGEWLLYPLESKYPHRPKLPQQVDGIIVLSGAEITGVSKSWGSVELNGAAERDTTFLELARRYPEAKLVFTGGTGSLVNHGIKGADIARRFFAQQGLDIGRITFERESRNTYENVILTQKLVQPRPDEKWVLITTGWHMPRARGIFCKNRWEVIPYPVDFNSQRENLVRMELDLSEHLNNLVTGVKEWMGILAYSLSGKMMGCP